MKKITYEQLMTKYEVLNEAAGRLQDRHNKLIEKSKQQEAQIKELQLHMGEQNTLMAERMQVNNEQINELVAENSRLNEELEWAWEAAEA